MSANQHIKIGPLKQSELEEAERIVRLAFGTFLGLPNPLDFMGDRTFVAPRWHSTHTKVIAAREGSRLIGSNMATRWGSFGFFGPLTVLPEYWDRGVAQRLLEATMTIFERWGLRHTGLFTFPQSAKHVGLYQKFGYWPRYLTAIMTRTPEANPARPGKRGDAPLLLSAFPKGQCEQAILSCRKLAHKIDKGLDLTGEIRAVLFVTAAKTHAPGAITWETYVVVRECTVAKVYNHHHVIFTAAVLPAVIGDNFVVLIDVQQVKGTTT